MYLFIGHCACILREELDDLDFVSDLALLSGLYLQSADAIQDRYTGIFRDQEVLG